MIRLTLWVLVSGRHLTKQRGNRQKLSKVVVLLTPLSHHTLSTTANIAKQEGASISESTLGFCILS